MVETAQSIPFTAWEQAVFVSLFIIFVMSLLAALLSWFSKQSDKWQLFIEASNEKWRAFNKEQREENNSCMAEVNKGLTNLTQVTSELVQTMNETRTDLYQHDQQAKEIKNLVVAVNTSVTKPKTTRSTTTKQ